MNRLEKQIIKKREEIRELNRQKFEQVLQKKLARKILIPRGRPKLKAELIEKAKEVAKIRPLTDVALSLGICLQSLYNKGISRKAINAENSLEANFGASDKNNSS